MAIIPAFLSIKIIMGSVLNHGVEGVFKWNDRVKDWAYSVGANFVVEEYKVQKWNQVLHGEEYRYAIGRATDAMMGLVAEGLFGKDVDINNHVALELSPIISWAILHIKT